jgi:geranylgeranyl diphosphate synthase type II
LDVAAYLKRQSQLVDKALDHATAIKPPPLEPPAQAVGQSSFGAASWHQGVMPHVQGVPPKLLEAVRYSLLAGGKRLRPVLVFAAAELYAAPVERVLPAALALEMIHTYSLVHDDLPCMDDDDLRRGRPTNHKVYGEGMATLVGDALLTMAFEMLGRQAAVPGVAPEQVNRVILEVAAAAGAAGMVGGQAEDLASEGQAIDLAHLQQIHQLKTGALFRAALRTGAILCGAGETDLGHLDRYAYHFGLAFQIQDDLLDVIGDTVKTGKGVGRDERHQKSTYVRHFGVEQARQRARLEVDYARESLVSFGIKSNKLVSLAEFVIDREA